MPRASIIMPVYNVAPYLGESIASARAQTLADIEIVCVDDGSTDGSGDILDAQASQDPRIRVIHQPNAGVSAAKNAGLKAASGDLIVFFDSDDLLEADACERLSRVFADTGAEVVVCGGRPFPAHDSYMALDDLLDVRDAVYEGLDMDLIMRERTRPFAWRTVCTRAFLDRTGIVYDERLSFAEDQVFQFAAYGRSEKTVLIADKLIDYRVRREGSFMQGIKRAGIVRTEAHIQAVDAILADWEQGGLLPGNEREMFDWSVEFLMRDLLMNASDADLQVLETQLARVWRAHFPDAFLEERASDARYGRFVRMVLDGGERPSRMRSALMLGAYMAHRRGASYLMRRGMAALRVSAPSARS